MGKTPIRRHLPSTSRLHMQNRPNRRIISRKRRNFRGQLGRRHGRRHLIHHRRNAYPTGSRDAYGHDSTFCFNDTWSSDYIRTFDTENTAQLDMTAYKHVAFATNCLRKIVMTHSGTLFHKSFKQIAATSVSNKPSKRRKVNMGK
jgi:hypothetical protein